MPNNYRTAAGIGGTARTSDPQTSAYVVLGLQEAKDSGYPVSDDVLNNGIDYLNKNLPELDQNAATWQYNRYAFMLYVLARGNELQAEQTNFIYQNQHLVETYMVKRIWLRRCLCSIRKTRASIRSCRT